MTPMPMIDQHLLELWETAFWTLLYTEGAICAWNLTQEALDLYDWAIRRQAAHAPRHATR